MKIIAYQGSNRYLIEVSPGLSVIVDWTFKKAFKPFNTQSILARGYWQEYKGPQELLTTLKPLIDRAVEDDKGNLDKKD